MDPRLTFTGIPAARCDDLWPVIEPILLRAIIRTDGRHSWLSVKNAIRNEDWQLWACFTDSTMDQCVAALTTTILNYPTGIRELEITLAAGDVLNADCLPILAIVEDWGRSVGCTAITLIGRRGWARVLPSFEESSMVLRKRL